MAEDEGSTANPAVEHNACVVRITPDLARSWLAGRNVLEAQRRIRPRHVAFFREVIQRGELDGSSPVHFAVLGSDRMHVLLDGQHRLAAIADGELPQNVVVIDTVVPNIGAARVLYSRKDRGLSRSVADAFRGLNEIPAGLTVSHAERVGRAALQIGRFDSGKFIQGGDYESRSAEYRAKLVAYWGDAAIAFYAAIEGGVEKITNLLDRAQILGVALVTFREPEAATRAARFWGDIARDDGLFQIDPRKALLNWLMHEDTRAGADLTIAHGAAVCWNRWWRGDDTVRQVRILDPRGKISLYGTSLDNGTDGRVKSGAQKRKEGARELELAGPPEAVSQLPGEPS